MATINKYFLTLPNMTAMETPDAGHYNLGFVNGVLQTMDSTETGAHNVATGALVDGVVRIGIGGSTVVIAGGQEAETGKVAIPPLYILLGVTITPLDGGDANLTSYESETLVVGGSGAFIYSVIGIA